MISLLLLSLQLSVSPFEVSEQWTLVCLRWCIEPTPKEIDARKEKTYKKQILVTFNPLTEPQLCWKAFKGFIGRRETKVIKSISDNAAAQRCLAEKRKSRVRAKLKAGKRPDLNFTRRVILEMSKAAIIATRPSWPHYCHQNRRASVSLSTQF